MWHLLLLWWWICTCCCQVFRPLDLLFFMEVKSDSSLWHCCDEQVQPAVEDAAGKLKPAAEQFTSGTVKPAGDYVAENAVPLTKQYGAHHHISCTTTSTCRADPLSLPTHRNAPLPVSKKAL